MKKFLILLLLLLTGCAARQGTIVHRVAVAEHSFLAVVTAFEDVEVSEHDKGFVPDDVHKKMQAGVQKVSLAGNDLTTSLAAGASSVTIKAKLDAIYTLLDSLNSDGVLAVKNPATKATLEIALDSIKAIVDNALIQVTP